MTQPPRDPFEGQPQEPGQQPDQGGYQQAFPGQTQFLPSGAFPGQEPDPVQPPQGETPYGAHDPYPPQPAHGQYPQPGAHSAQPPDRQPNVPPFGQFAPGQHGADPAAGHPQYPAGQAYPGQQYPSQQLPGEQHPGQQYPGQQFQQEQYQQAPYGQVPPAGGYPRQPGGYPNPYGQTYGPRRRNTTPLLLAGGGLLVIGVVVTLILVLSGDGTGSPRGTTEAFIAAVKDRDAEAFNKLMCDEDDKTTQKEIDEDRDVQITDTSVTNVTENGDTAVGEFTASISGRETKIRLQLRKRGDAWCVDRIGRG
ncbi:protein of unknown function [Actinokineospora terrae]|uniref:DUF4878 domain-containing protein n=2 Tax=Actinokineospora terrae TaxID=155974 RepID=A0A1H9N4F3_9PSEU|nr:protein of unknown function [Actinokineospora terrae]